MNRKIKFFLLFSVLLNVILVGVIAGYSYHRYKLPPRDKVIALLERSSLPSYKKEELKAQLYSVFPDEERKKERRLWQQHTLTLLVEDNFDAEAYRSGWEEMLEKRHEQKKRLIEVMINIALELNKEEREELAAIMRRAWNR